MNGVTKLVGIVAVAAVTAIMSFREDIALALGAITLALGGLAAVAVVVGAAVAARAPRRGTENRRAPAIDAAPAISPLQKQ